MEIQRHKPINTGSLPEPEFSFRLSKVALAQICKSVGFKEAQSSALEALTDIATRYLKVIAKLAADSANSRRRTESNLLDVVVALEDLGSVRGFRGGSDTNLHTLYKSQVVKDLMEFVKYTHEIPFAQPLDGKFFCRGGKVNFLKHRGVEDNNNWYSDGVGLMHVPRWLPIMPEMGGEEKGEERKREGKWGCLNGGIEGEGEKRWGMGIWEGKVVEKEGSKEIESLRNRKKVKFKLRVDGNRNGGGMVGNYRGGVCRGGGIGKRVLCKDWSGGGGECECDEEENKRMMKVMNKISR
ncbi:unnamed protein product [Fraxinus pennsylvanica]|uniref:Bromodomain associated domain-containing protein n=1 Tax=Fraxinus pennsylvanica TaxID=56036 RepID=A0AAD1YYZ2_9LAMI|nr:unnamed protein product [Fraxinus pennsylvanica]